MTAKRPVGRPHSTAASAHSDIMDAVHELLQAVSVRDLTMEAVAKRAGVGKPTLYKWWRSKGELVLAMLEERMVPELTAPTSDSLEESIRIKAHRLVDTFTGFFGKVVSGLIAEGQSEPEILERFRVAYILPRRAETIADIRRAQEQGLFARAIEPDLVVDFVFGSIYFHMLSKVHPLDHAYADALVDAVFRLPLAAPNSPPTD